MWSMCAANVSKASVFILLGRTNVRIHYIHQRKQNPVKEFLGIKDVDSFPLDGKFLNFHS